jgi:23S rRNA pseudouridine1911/1915/1917 synthase
VVHTDGRTEEKSLVDWLNEYMSGGVAPAHQSTIGNPHTLDSGRYVARWGIVNRLDRDTSGIILIAKDNETFFDLQKQFQEHKVVKEYLALVHGSLDLEKPENENKIQKGKENFYKICEPISRHKKDPRIWVCGFGVGERNSKRDAETIFFIPPPEGGRLGGGILNKRNTLLHLFPKTGRTHQLRLHCRFVGHPIVGDKKYGISGVANEHGTEQIKGVLEKISNEELLFEKKSRLMLHAKGLEFFHPKTGQKIRIESLANAF